jgi:UDPglucose 6-dehydrogenase
VGTGDFVRNVIETNRRRNVDFDVVSNPEFLREGSAIQDTLHPDRIVVGAPNQVVAMKILELYAPLERPMIITDVASAEMIKHASNSFLATKISFANAIANICDAVGADVVQVMKGMGSDNRIGMGFLNAGLGYGGSCFGPDETVFTVKNNKTYTERFDQLFASSGTPLQDKSGVEVIKARNLSVQAFDMLTGKPKIAAVDVLTRRKYTGEMITLKTSMGRNLRVTADHPVIIRNGENNCAIRRADRVQVGEQLLALTELPAMPPATETLNLISMLSGTELEKDVHVCPIEGDNAFTDQWEIFGKYIPATMLKHPIEIKYNNRMPLRVYNYLTAQGVLDVPAERLLLYTAKGAATKIRATIPVDAAFVRMLGYYLAEGCIAKDTGRAGAVRERVLFSFHENEAEYISDVRTTIESLGMKWSERVATHASTTIISSRIFAFLLRDMLACGTRSEDKTLPTFAYSLTPALRHELIRGAFSGDGSIEPLQNGKNVALVYGTVSKRLADGLALLLQSVGIVSSIKTRWMTKSTMPAYLLVVSGHAQMTQMRDAFGVTKGAKLTQILDGYQKKIKQHGFERGECVSYLTIKSIERETVDMFVYSLETETETLIASSGLVAHNCFPKDSRSLLHTARSVGYDFPLLAATIETNEAQPKRFIDSMEKRLGTFKGKKVAVLGLAFKANTDDMREAKSLDVIAALLEGGAEVRAYDPIAIENTKKIFPQITYAKNAYEAAQEADAVVVVTEWNEFKQLNLERLKEVMKGNHLFDGRNLYDPAKVGRLGFEYLAVGRAVKK